LGFTGSYEGQPVSVMGTGMGIPSISIYATELVTHFGCRRLVRVGSCGAIQARVAMRDVVVAVGACTDSAVNRQRFGGWDLAAVADYDLLRRAMDACTATGVAAHSGTVMSSDLFYPPGPGADPLAYYLPAVRLGVLAIEMEAAGLYGVAAEHGVAALAVCTVSDHLVSGERLSAEERQSSFDEMVAVALRTVTGG
jgi:purine-nucleoside phosphorylase